MAGREVAGIRASVDEGGPLSGGQRLDHNLRLLPAVIGGTLGEGKQYRLSTRKHLWSLCHFIRLDLHQHFRCPAVRRKAQHPIAALADENAVRAPTQAEGISNRTERDRGATGDANALERLVGA